MRIQRFHRPSAAQTHATRTASTRNTHTHFPCPLCACATCMPRDLSAPALARGPRSATSACTAQSVSPARVTLRSTAKPPPAHCMRPPGTMHSMLCDPSATARPTLDPQSERPPHARGPLTPAASAFPSTRPSHVRTRLRVACTVRLRPARHTHTHTSAHTRQCLLARASRRSAGLVDASWASRFTCVETLAPHPLFPPPLPASACAPLTQTLRAAAGS